MVPVFLYNLGSNSGETEQHKWSFVCWRKQRCSHSRVNVPSQALGKATEANVTRGLTGPEPPRSRVCLRGEGYTIHPPQNHVDKPWWVRHTRILAPVWFCYTSTGLDNFVPQLGNCIHLFVVWPRVFLQCHPLDPCPQALIQMRMYYNEAHSQQPAPLEGIQVQNSRLYTGLEHDTMY